MAVFIIFIIPFIFLIYNYASDGIKDYSSNFVLISFETLLKHFDTILEGPCLLMQ